MIDAGNAYRREQEKRIAAPMHAQVRFVAGDAGSASSWGDNGHTAWSRLDILALPQVPSNAAYATLEPGRTLANGRLKALPDDASLYKNEGFVSSALSGADGMFDTPPQLWFLFDEPHSAPGLTLVFDEAAGEWPRQVVVKVLDANERPLLNRTLNPQGVVLNVDAPVEHFTQVQLQFTQCLPRRRARLNRMSFGTQITLSGAQLTNVRQTLETDPIGRRLPEGSLSFTVVNENQFSSEYGQGHLYDPDNPDGLWEYLDERQPVSLYWGQELNGGIGWRQAAQDTWGELYSGSWGGVYGRNTVQWIDGGHYYLNGKPKVSGLTAQFSAQDILSTLDGVYEKGVYAPAGRSLYDLATDLLSDESLPDVLRLAKPWRLWEGLRQIDSTAPLPARTYRECLQLIAHAACCCLYTDRLGTICIEPAPSADTGWAAGPAMMLGRPQVQKTARPGGARCAIYRYRPQTDAETLFEGDISVNGTTQVHLSYASSMAQNITATGATLVNSAPYAHGADLTLSGTGTAHIVVTGHPLNTETVWATALGTGTGDIAQFENPLLTDSTAAMAAAQWALAYLENRSTYVFETRGTPEAEPLDLFQLTGSFSSGQARLLRCETNFSGEMRTKITAKRLG